MALGTVPLPPDQFRANFNAFLTKMTLFLFRLDGTVVGYSAQGSKIPRKARAHHIGDLSRWVGLGFYDF